MVHPSSRVAARTPFGLCAAIAMTAMVLASPIAWVRAQDIPIEPDAPDIERLVVRDVTPDAPDTSDTSATDSAIPGWHFIDLASTRTASDARTIGSELVASGLVGFAEPDFPVHVLAEPDDVLFAQQWSLGATASNGIGADLAWDISVGDPSGTIAVIDTGWLPHPDLSGRIVAGFDFVSSMERSRDGDRRDPDATDSGDSCGGGSSSWHGTHIAGILGATTNNGIGIAGVDQRARIQPIRAVGSCFGWSTDVADAIRWAAGGSVNGVPKNATPARVINVSLGGENPCTAYQQDAVDSALAAGAIVVAAAGNAGVDAGSFAPANCDGVIGVGASGPTGALAGYSAVAAVDVVAPGGDGSSESGSQILSLGNTGIVDPAAGADAWTYVERQGTSMAAAHVSGTISLMASVYPSMDGDEALRLLNESSGSGIPSRLNAGAALRLAAAEVDVYEPVRPLRLVDTRLGLGVAEVRSGLPVAVEVLGVGGVPVNGVGAVALNVTIVDPDAVGHATVYACDRPIPVASNVNYVAGRTVANLVNVGLGPLGGVCVVSSANAELVIDVEGWFPSAVDGFEPAAPQRLVDTRQDLGAVALQAGVPVTVETSIDTSKTPADTVAVALNVTIVGPAGRGHATIFPCEDAVPLSSNANFAAGQTVANAVIVGTGVDGRVCVVSSTDGDLVVDLAGWFRARGGFEPVRPWRVVDTRRDHGLRSIAPESPARIDLAAADAVPRDATAVVLTVTIVGPALPGHATVHACDAGSQVTSSVNFTAGRTVANSVIAALDATQIICLTTSAAADVVVDVMGWVVGQPDGATTAMTVSPS